MQFIQAKRLGNKLCVRDNRFFTIDKVEFLRNGGFVVTVIDYDGYSYPLAYHNEDLVITILGLFELVNN